MNRTAPPRLATDVWACPNCRAVVGVFHTMNQVIRWRQVQREYRPVDGARIHISYPFYELIREKWTSDWASLLSSIYEPAEPGIALRIMGMPVCEQISPVAVEEEASDGATGH